MTRSLLCLLIAGVASLTATEAGAQARCTRTYLQNAVDAFLAAQGKGDPSRLPLATSLAYVENGKSTPLAQSILHTALKIDFSRSLLDAVTCETFTEIVVTDKSHPYVIGSNLRLAKGKIVAIESLVSDQDDWLFDADNVLKISPTEDWGVIAKIGRDSRAKLLAAANAYFDVFKDNSVKVPWGTPCNRLEGGLRTGKGAPDDSCNVGVPSGMDIHDRHFVVDQDIGSVVGLNRFGENNLPDSHLFRIESGKIRYVHTITICTLPHCGFPVREPAESP
ncbi:MAG TPA: hypothetical protein VL131_03455 [Gammaproteobacteria bacterium]|nr:hypothetical protein [Gammaproteobacteria bacterium]